MDSGVRGGDRLCRGLAALAAQVAFDRGEGTAEPVGQHLQALVRMGVPEAYHLAVVDLVCRPVTPASVSKFSGSTVMSSRRRICARSEGVVPAT